MIYRKPDCILCHSALPILTGEIEGCSLELNVYASHNLNFFSVVFIRRRNEGYDGYFIYFLNRLFCIK